jgi:putative membrane protein
MGGGRAYGSTPTRMIDEGPTDPRSLLATERTLLAWLRTGLSLITFGFVIARIGVWLRATGAEDEIKGSGWMGALFVALGSVANLMALFRYLAFRKAILRNAVVPTGRLALISFATSIALLGALLSAVVLSNLF